MDDIYWYFIILLIFIIILPEDKRIFIMMAVSGISLLLLMYITLDYHYPLDDSESVSTNDNGIQVEPTESHDVTDALYMDNLINRPYNKDVVDEYYAKPAYEEQFADYGLAKAQKRLLHHNDVMRENESKFQSSKFAPFFGDEMDIKYEDAWYGPDY
jgi:hypothetical protein